jgi:hypothetical protein
MIAEKRLALSKYDTGDWFDERGWTDGWDTFRSTSHAIGPDADQLPSEDSDEFGHRFGVGAFLGRECRVRRRLGAADFVHIEQEILNGLGHRSEGLDDSGAGH